MMVVKDLELREDCNPLFDRRCGDHHVDRSTLEYAHSAAGRGTLRISSALALPSNLGAGVLPLARRRDGLDC